MNHKTLKCKCRMASNRSNKLCLALARLSGKDVLTPEEKGSLETMRKAANRTIQYVIRLGRRHAKSTRAEYVPSLCRSSFKKRTTFKRIENSQGKDAAMAYLLEACSSSHPMT